MEDIIDDAIIAIEGFFTDLFRMVLKDRLEAMFSYVDDATSLISDEVAKTPSGWNSTIFTTLENIATDVILPIGTMIITALLCYEIINMVINQNHIARDGGETSFFFIIIFKACIAVYLLAHSFDITVAIFDVGSSVITSVSDSYLTPTAESLEAWEVTTFAEEIYAMNVGELMAASIEAVLINTAMSIMSILIEIVLFGRMMEIYMYISIAPLPFSTLINREWGMIGTNYIKTLCALAFQTFFIIICVVIFNALVVDITSTTLVRGMWDVLTYAVLLAMMLFKSGSISRSIFNAH